MECKPLPLTRLPFPVREELCFRLRDRQTWAQLNEWLATLGYGPYIAQNYTNFKASRHHYVAWLSEQRRLEERRARADTIKRELEADGFSTLDHTMLRLVDSLSDPSIDPVKAASAVAALKSAVTAQARVSLEQERVRLAASSAELDKAKFQFMAAGRFLQWFSDERARKIAESGEANEAKIAKLVALMESMKGGE